MLFFPLFLIFCHTFELLVINCSPVLEWCFFGLQIFACFGPKKLILTIHAKDFCEKIGRNSPDLARKMKNKKCQISTTHSTRHLAKNIERLLGFSSSIPILQPNLATASCG
jgi:hypothetical protein